MPRIHRPSSTMIAPPRLWITPPNLALRRTAKVVRGFSPSPHRPAKGILPAKPHRHGLKPTTTFATAQTKARRIWPLSILLFALLHVLPAAEPPTAPILRIEAGMHTAPINSIATDAAGRVALTCSDDKTARL